jgi:hypothetical protein
MDDWTSITDIGKVFRDKVLDAVEYFTTENMHIKAVKLIVNELGMNQFYVNSLEKNFKIANFYYMVKKYTDYYPDRLIEVFRSIKDGMELSGEDACDLCRLVLREHLWCNLISRDRSLIITFGSDYSMRIFCRELRKEMINSIRDSGLFIEIMDAKGTEFNIDSFI